MHPVDLAALRAAVAHERYIITSHAKQRMGLRQVTDDELKHVVVTGDLIEDYPSAKPFPKALLMAHVRGEPLYVVCAFDSRYAYIITVHWYDPEQWNDPWTRKRK